MSNALENPIQIVLNGEATSVPEAISLAQLLDFLDLSPDHVAIEKDFSLVRKPDWPNTEIHGGARIEIVQFVGGG